MAGEAQRVWSHHFTVGAAVVLDGWLVHKVADRYFQRRLAFPQLRGTWVPLLLTAIAVGFLLLDPMRHLVMDHGVKEGELKMYNRHGGLTLVGRICQASSLSGLLLLFAGIFWCFALPAPTLGKDRCR